MLTEIFRWLIVLAAINVVSFPVSYCFFSFLPGRGVAFSRILGMILIGYGFWIINLLGLGGNTIGTLTVVLLILCVASAVCLKRNYRSMRIWIQANWKYFLICEILFLIAFFLIVLFRTSDPSISGTEKPMEMMFINSILKSEQLPPWDGWLSGYSISYYYFGYILTSVLIRLADVPSPVGFNLMLATVFSLAAAAAYALVNDLLNGRVSNFAEKIRVSVWSLLAPVFLLIAGNLEGFFEVLHARGLFWKSDGSSVFWQWLGLQELNMAPTLSPSWDPTGRQGIWWWRASRVLSDQGLDGSIKEIIDEFPFFSFFLGDLHPHVLGIPFVLLAIGVAMNTYFRQTGKDLEDSDKRFNLSREINWMFILFKSPHFLLSGLFIGSLIFINTWDFPIYFALFCGAAVFYPEFKFRSYPQILRLLIRIAIPFGVGCVGFYFLFLSGLSSQAGGFVPSGVFSTRLIHFLIMFGGMLLPIALWLTTGIRSVEKSAFKKAVRLTSIVFGLLLGVMTLLVGALILFAALGPGMQSSQNGLIARLGSMMILAGNAYMDVQGMRSASQPLIDFLLRRLNWIPLAVLLFGALSLVFAFLFTNRSDSAVLQGENSKGKIAPSDRFAALLGLLGFGLIIFPEFFYLRDFFGNRMNTIFKFYYQSWILLSLLATYSLARLQSILDKRNRLTATILSSVLLFAALIYPALGFAQKTENLYLKISDGNQKLTLDGTGFLQRGRPDDWAGILWMQEAAPGVVLEKVGGSYTSDNAVSVFSGQPAVLGPTNHESQWRGGYQEIGSREADIQTIYETRDWEIAKSLIDQYQIQYVFIGSAERSSYQVQEQKFDQHLVKVFEQGQTRIYQVN